MKNKTLGIITLTTVIMLVMITCDDEEVVDNSKFYFDPPTGITATVLSDNSRTIYLTWNEVPRASHYEISFRTNLDSKDTRRSAGTATVTRYEHNYYSWSFTTGGTTLYYYVKTHPRESGYIASDWSNPVSVNIN